MAMTTWDELPAVITTYLEHPAVGAFADGATVIDDGHTHHGLDRIRDWLERAASEYTFTTTFMGATRVGDTRWDVSQHVAGDFPGGTVDLHYRFTLDGDRITELIIEP